MLVTQGQLVRRLFRFIHGGVTINIFYAPAVIKMANIDLGLPRLL